MIYAAVLGYGTVGSGVVEAIHTNKEKLKKAAGDEIAVRYILDLRDFEGDPFENLVVHDFSVIENDPEVSIVVETMGGIHPAYEFTMAALKKGKSVCTSNKALVADCGYELMQTAKANNCSYFFEASCGGGIPVIRALTTSLAGEEILEITGILNGTTNYILTRMADEGSAFSEVLADAQALGYAEKDPTADVEGHDACRKIAILISLALGKRVDFKDIYTEGISRITPEDITTAKALGGRIRLLAGAKVTDHGLEAMVAPYMVGKDSPLYGVNDVFNAVFVRGNILGDSMFYGRGAGKLPTASAVVGDVLECAKTLGKHASFGWDDEKPEMTAKDGIVNRFLVRIPDAYAARAAEVFPGIVFADSGIFEQCAFITEEMTEKDFEQAFASLGPNASRIRVK